ATALTTAYKNATGIRKDAGKWLLTQEGKESIAYLARATQKSVAELVVVENGIGTWLHPDLAEILAQWISVEYRFAVVALIRREKEAAKASMPQPSYLLPSPELMAAREIREMTDLLDDNPRLLQVLIDSRINEFVEKALPDNAPQLRGVAEVAVEMGYKIDDSSRIKLGQFVAKQGLDFKKEKRLCNGVMTPINCYPDTPELREAISAFFN
ncbi:MAG: KilA-N domain-containing protein, partial [Aeromonas sp.]